MTMSTHNPTTTTYREAQPDTVTAIKIGVPDFRELTLDQFQIRVDDAIAHRDRDPLGFACHTIRSTIQAALADVRLTDSDRTLLKSIWRTAHPNITDLIPGEDY